MGVMMRIRNTFFLALAIVGIAGCAVNPVTGKPELSLVSEAQEIQIGEQNYPYMQQSGGGQYDVDPDRKRSTRRRA